MVRGDGDDAASDGPQPPSSPDLTDVVPPTPDGVLSGSPRSGAQVIRPSDVAGASTEAPTVGDGSGTCPPFDARQVPLLQCRVTAFLCEVDGDRPRPFLPTGCPSVVHNPFTESAQCPLVTPEVASGQIFRFMLQDYSNRRGWQPLVPVLPQPDEHAIHLVPAAADPSLVAVVLRTDRHLLASYLACRPYSSSHRGRAIRQASRTISLAAGSGTACALARW